MQLYISKLNPNCSAFDQYPKRKWSADYQIWYENRPLGINKLGDMMKDISAEAELSQKYTNHCVRATAITLWSNAGLANRHILAIPGHRNEQSLKSWATHVLLRFSFDKVATFCLEHSSMKILCFNCSWHSQTMKSLLHIRKQIRQFNPIRARIAPFLICLKAVPLVLLMLCWIHVKKLTINNRLSMIDVKTYSSGYYPCYFTNFDARF